MPLLLIILFIVFLLLSAFFSSSETAFFAFNRVRLNYLTKKGNKKASFIKKTLENPEKFLASLLIGNNFVNIAAASIATFIFSEYIFYNKSEAIFYSTMITTFIILIFSEITPKSIAAAHPERISLLYVIPIRIIILVLSPISRLISYFINFFLKLTVRKREDSLLIDAEEELNLFIKSESSKRNISMHKKRMLEGVFDIRERRIKEVMIPRTKVVAIDMDLPLDKIFEIVLSTEFSRYPIYEERVDNVKGVIHSKDLFPFVLEKENFSITKIIRDAYFIPETAKVETILKEMQRKKMHLAIVTDEWGSMSGIVTLEDILEEIVGEIQDEYDEEEEEFIIRLTPKLYLIKGKTPIKVLNEKLFLNIPENRDFVTIAGFILYKLGRMPSKGDEIMFNKNRFIIEKIERNYIELVRLIIK
ncbi:MAG: hemolysin family protein [Acidobacteriota bacterium]